MKLSEMKPGDIASFDKLVILAINDTDKMYVLEGAQIKRSGIITVDITVEPSDPGTLLSTLDVVDHKGDWISMMHADFIKQQVITL
jgi:hypothetical protein